VRDDDNFLDATVEVNDFFPDENKFIHRPTVKLLQRNVSYEVFSKQRFRLKKMLTKLRKDKANTLQYKSNG